MIKAQPNEIDTTASLYQQQYDVSSSYYYSPTTNVGVKTTTTTTTIDSGTSFVYLPHKVAQEGNLAALQTLLQNYPDLLTDRDNNGWTLLHEAAKGGHVSIAEYLISIGADMNAQALDGYTPLYEAQRYHGPASSIAMYFRNLGAIYEFPKQRLRGKQEEIVKNYAHTLAGRGDLMTLKQYVKEHGSEFLKAPDANGWTLLHEAARYGQIEMAIYLLENGGLHINTRTKKQKNNNDDGLTALDVAIQYQGEQSTIAQLFQSMLNDRRRRRG
eukprot:scaffold628_cov91-Cylindrotheca_fusiformis.AAC.3